MKLTFGPGSAKKFLPVALVALVIFFQSQIYLSFISYNCSSDEMTGGLFVSFFPATSYALLYSLNRSYSNHILAREITRKKKEQNRVGGESDLLRSLKRTAEFNLGKNTFSNLLILTSNSPASESTSYFP